MEFSNEPTPHPEADIKEAEGSQNGDPSLLHNNLSLRMRGSKHPGLSNNLMSFQLYS